MRGAGRLALLIAIWLAGAASASAEEPLGNTTGKAAPCLVCHGASGQSQLPTVPSLGAQREPYTITQLYLFREKMRVAEPMNDLAKDLSDDDLRSLAAVFVGLPAPKPPTEAPDQARLDRAAGLVGQNHCNICHRPDFSGQENVPRIADQREDYLLKSLRDYKSGKRPGYEPTMAEALQPLSDAQLADLAYYLAHFH